MAAIGPQLNPSTATCPKATVPPGGDNSVLWLRPTARRSTKGLAASNRSVPDEASGRVDLIEKVANEPAMVVE
jgi:hypothetical protein